MDHVKCIWASQSVPFCISNINFLNYNNCTHTSGDTHQARDINLITTTIIIIVYLLLVLLQWLKTNKQKRYKIINGSLLKCANE